MCFSLREILGNLLDPYYEPLSWFMIIFILALDTLIFINQTTSIWLLHVDNFTVGREEQDIYSSWGG